MSAPSAVERVHAAYAAIERVDRPEIWITLRPLADALADAVRVDAAARTGAELPLAGLVAAVKNNIDVAGIPTTAGCPTYKHKRFQSLPCILCGRLFYFNIFCVI